MDAVTGVEVVSNPMDNAPIKPCPNPWCEALDRDGDFSPKALRASFATWQVCCTSCEQVGPIRTTEPAAIAAWNTRTPGPQVTALLALVIQYRDDLRRPPMGDSLERRLDAINGAIAKATQ